MPETDDQRCGICHGPKSVLKTYNATRVGVKMQAVRLCQRCDLTPDPAPSGDKGVG